MQRIGRDKRPLNQFNRSCSKIAQTDYKERHNKVASMLHWNLCKKYYLPASDKWWEHNVEKVLQNEEVKIL